MRLKLTPKELLSMVRDMSGSWGPGNRISDEAEIQVYLTDGMGKKYDLIDNRLIEIHITDKHLTPTELQDLVALPVDHK